MLVCWHRNVCYLAPVYVNCEYLHNYLNIAEFGMAHGDNNGASNKDQKPILIYF